MANTQYSTSSPYFGTNSNGQFLGLRTDRKIPKLSSDSLITISAVYHLRPDLLAADLYGDPALWWVFAQRNPNILRDPLFGFVSGISIYIPTKATLSSALGV